MLPKSQISKQIVQISTLHKLIVFLCLFFSNSPAHKYYLATSPISGALYLSDTSSRKVFKVKSLNTVKDVAKNLELVAGTGDQCLPYDETRCGDGGKAVEATLTNPRGKPPYIWITASIYFRNIQLFWHYWFNVPIIPTRLWANSFKLRML